MKSLRKLLASIAARLATSVNTDYADAAKQLDAALSPAEKAPPLRVSDTAGFVLLHTAMNLGPMTMNTLIVSR